MMANDTFVQDWLKNSEEDQSKIIEYLSSIKNKYSMFSTFLVSERTGNYYTQDKFIEKVIPSRARNKWYFNFKAQQNIHEINIDYNANLSNSLMMFINYKILDTHYKFIGATGVALKTEYIHNMLKRFRQQYGFKVTFFNHLGEAVLSEPKYNSYHTIDESPLLRDYKEKILSKQSNSIEIRDDETYIINTKYIPELNLYLTIEVTLNEYTNSSITILYFNLLAAFFVLLFVIVILYRIIQNHNKELQSLAYFDPLTKIYNRRIFETKLSDAMKHSKRYSEPFSLLFIDIDNFKNVNDTMGHDVGDKVLLLVATLLKSSIREVDIIARWGGEEMVIMLSNVDIEHAKILSENLRALLASDRVLFKLLNYNLTASFGVTQFQSSDSIERIIKRADEAMYLSKEGGKNRVSVL